MQKSEQLNCEVADVDLQYLVFLVTFILVVLPFVGMYPQTPSSIIPFLFDHLFN